MEQNNKKISKNNKKKLLKIFAISSGVTLLLCIGIIASLVAAYNTTVIKPPDASVEQENLSEEEKQKEEEREERGELNKTIAVFGVDMDGTRTDVIFVVNFNTITNKIKVVNIPRDTKVVWSARQRENYNKLTGYNIYESKLNEMSAYGRVYSDPANIRKFTINEIENILTVPIDNFVIVNLEAFNKIVDAIGGVEVDVPNRMYYVDNSQGLYIDLQPGLQVLDGKAAEGLVRFRKGVGGYAEGDTGRIAAQQLFLQAFAEKVMSPAIMKDLPTIITSLFTYVKTDIQLMEVFSYLEMATDFKTENIEFHTAPGYTIDKESPAYYHIDDEKMAELIKDMFYDTEVAGEDDTEIEEDTTEEEDIISIDYDVSMQIYNATNTRGLAGTLKDRLNKRGYTVESIHNYEDGKLEDTVIYAKDKEQARQFAEYLTDDVEIIEDSSMDVDIMIIMGEDVVELF